MFEWDLNKDTYTAESSMGNAYSITRIDWEDEGYTVTAVMTNGDIFGPRQMNSFHSAQMYAEELEVQSGSL